MQFLKLYYVGEKNIEHIVEEQIVMIVATISECLLHVKCFTYIISFNP